MYIYKYMYMYIYILIDIYIYIYIHTYIYVYMYLYMYIYLDAHMFYIVHHWFIPPKFAIIDGLHLALRKSISSL